MATVIVRGLPQVAVSARRVFMDRTGNGRTSQLRGSPIYFRGHVSKRATATGGDRSLTKYPYYTQNPPDSDTSLCPIRGVSPRSSARLSSSYYTLAYKLGLCIYKRPKLMNRNVTAASLSAAETCVESGDPAS
jgi:hypothetical protein